MRAAVDCRERDQGDVREEIVVGNACGGKPGDTAESHIEGGATTIDCLSSYSQHQLLNNT